MKIIVSYRGIPESRGWATGDYMVQAFRELGHDAVPYGNYYQTDEWMGRDTAGADLLLWMECNDADPQYTELHQLKCHKVMWDFDTAMHPEFTYNQAGKFDQVYLANPRFLQVVPGAKYLPYAADSVRFGPTGVTRDGAAIIGSPFPERVKFAKDAGIDLWSGYHRHDYVIALGRCKVSVHHHDSGGTGLLVMRIFETMACGTCLLAPRTETMERSFVDGLHYVSYTDAAHAKKRIATLLENGEWKRIGAAGREEVLSKHTYRHRAQAILAGLR